MPLFISLYSDINTLGFLMIICTQLYDFKDFKLLYGFN